MAIKSVGALNEIETAASDSHFAIVYGRGMTGESTFYKNHPFK